MRCAFRCNMFRLELTEMTARRGRVIAQAGFSTRLLDPRSGHVEYMVDRVALGQVSS